MKLELPREKIIQNYQTMKLNVTIAEMIQHQLQPNHVFLLLLLYNKDFETCKNLFGIEESIRLRNDLLETPFILSGQTKFTETIISKDKVGKFLGFKGDNINFWEFYNCYPIRVGTRVIRAAKSNSKIAEKHEAKYLKIVKTEADHRRAIKAIETFVSKKKQANELAFLPDMETVMNNAMWQKWEALIEEAGTENAAWNSEEI